MVLLLLTFCLLTLPLWESVIVCFVVRYFLSIHSSFAIILMGKREVVALLNLSLSSDGLVPLPRGAMGLSAICDCGIS